MCADYMRLERMDGALDSAAEQFCDSILKSKVGRAATRQVGNGGRTSAAKGCSGRSHPVPHSAIPVGHAISDLLATDIHQLLTSGPLHTAVFHPLNRAVANRLRSPAC